MHIPKPALFIMALFSAAFVGWMLHSSAGASTTPRIATQAASTQSAQQPVHVTLVLPDSIGGTPRAGASRLSRAAGSTAPPAEQLASPSSRVQAGSAAPDQTAGPIYINGPASAPGLSVIANGNHIVVAAQGSIVSVGDNTVVKGNTGDASSSGSIAIDVADSSLSTGESSVAPQWPAGTRRPAGGTTYPLHALNGGSSTRLNSRVTSGSATGAGSRAIGIAGYKIHSVDIGGNDNFATYHDSALFYQRNGMVNGNTGDTYTSGLNVVDSIGSRVRSGASGNFGQAPPPAPFNPAGLGSASRSGALATPPTGNASVSIADINGISTATGQESVVIGGDGFSDFGVRTRGDRNAVTYDDGQAAIGGTGNVNAQIGDSSASGAEAMGVRYSDVAAGNSIQTARHPVGGGDPSDGNDAGFWPANGSTPRLQDPPAPLIPSVVS